MGWVAFPRHTSNLPSGQNFEESALRPGSFFLSFFWEILHEDREAMNGRSPKRRTCLHLPHRIEVADDNGRRETTGLVVERASKKEPTLLIFGSAINAYESKG
jgi:hypothetical protein